MYYNIQWTELIEETTLYLALSKTLTGLLNYEDEIDVMKDLFVCFLKLSASFTVEMSQSEWGCPKTRNCVKYKRSAHGYLSYV